MECLRYLAWIIGEIDDQALQENIAISSEETIIPD